MLHVEGVGEGKKYMAKVDVRDEDDYFPLILPVRCRSVQKCPVWASLFGELIYQQQSAYTVWWKCVYVDERFSLPLHTHTFIMDRQLLIADHYSVYTYIFCTRSRIRKHYLRVHNLHPYSYSSSISATLEERKNMSHLQYWSL